MTDVSPLADVSFIQRRFADAGYVADRDLALTI